MAKTSTTVAISPGVLITIILACFTAVKGGEYGLERYQNGKANAPAPTELVERVAVVETTVAAQARALERFDEKLDKILELVLQRR